MKILSVPESLTILQKIIKSIGQCFRKNCGKETPFFNLETCLSKKDGTIVWVYVTSVLFKDDGKTYGYTLLEDITRQYHEKIKKEEFISVASHELKTPITTMKASLQLMNRMISDEFGWKGNTP